MSILNVNQIQPVGSGQTVTISAANITASSATITAGSVTSSGAAPALTDAEEEANSYYRWDEDAYQADNTTGWALETPEASV